MSMAPQVKIAVGVVIERRKAESPWADFTWKAVAVLVGVPDAAPWAKLSEDGDSVTFYAGAAEIELFRTEAGHYRDNRVKYIFEHPDEFVAAGGLGAAFGVGAGNQTYISTDNGQFQNAVTKYFAAPTPL